MAIMAIEITAAQARQMTGRCGYHGSDLQLVPYADDGLDDILDGWYCPSLQHDPESKRISESGETLEEKRAFWRVLWERCEGSWVLTVPDPE